MVRQAGAREVHVRISCPPTIAPCFYGVDTPTRDELIGANLSVEDIARHIDADSLGYLSLEGLASRVRRPVRQSSLHRVLYQRLSDTGHLRGANQD